MNISDTLILEENDELKIWKNFQHGCEKSFTYFHETYYNDLYAYAFKLVQDEYLVKNAIQELFVYLWKNKRQLGEVRHVKFYLIFSLRRHIGRLSKKEEKFKRSSYFSWDSASAFGFSPEDVLITKETACLNEERLIHALNQLPLRQREIIYLRYFQELNNAEIAETLSIHYQSVQNCLGRALKNLRKNILIQNTAEVSLLLGLPILLLFL